VTTGSLQFANSLQALNSFLDELSGAQTCGGFALHLPKRNRHGISKCGVN
jgi:hypothetical protein